MSKIVKGAVASLTAAALTTGLCVPAANAFTITSTPDKCTVTLTASELAKLGLEEQTITIDDVENAGKTAYNYEKSLATYDEYIADDKERYENEYYNKEEFDRVLASHVQQKEIHKLLATSNRACNRGLSGEFEIGDLLNVKKDEEKPGDTNKDDTNKGDKPSEKPANPLVDENGKLTDAGIGVTVTGAVVGVAAIIAAILPMLKSILPTAIAALLP